MPSDLAPCAARRWARMCCSTKKTSNSVAIFATSFGMPVVFDKWILLKLDQAIREITDAFLEYKFNEAAQVLYRFFWNEYCDWYVEASKAILTRPVESSEATAASHPNASTDKDAARRA